MQAAKGRCRSSGVACAIGACPSGSCCEYTEIAGRAYPNHASRSVYVCGPIDSRSSGVLVGSGAGPISVYARSMRPGPWAREGADPDPDPDPDPNAKPTTATASPADHGHCL